MPRVRAIVLRALLVAPPRRRLRRLRHMQALPANGETRTRTGDTTIFSGLRAVRLVRARCVLARNRRNRMWVVAELVSEYRAARDVSGDALAARPCSGAGRARVLEGDVVVGGADRSCAGGARAA
jgi:hypothetical protein